MNTDDQPKLVTGNLAHVDPRETLPTTWISGAHRVISRGTASPVLVTDEQWRIVSLNPEAERFLGCSASDAEGRPCNTLLYGRDRFGNHVPPEQCDVGLMARRSEPVHPFEFDVVTATGDTIRAACSVIVLRDGLECRIVHILTPIPRPVEDTSATSQINGHAVKAPARDAKVAQRYGLTAREYEVLRLLADGSDCQGIAEALFISLPTVRNHVHNFLRKLNVHSQVEAVALAYRERLI
jgi:DNA-binding CsgD family transcriptional regulator